MMGWKEFDGKDKLCDRAPKGWRCYQPFQHTGPCPAWPSTWTSIKLWLRGIRT